MKIWTRPEVLAVATLAAGLFVGCPGGQGAPTIASFTASSVALPAGGGQVLLAWSEAEGTTVSIDQGIGDVTAESSITASVTVTTTFTLTATNDHGSAQKSLTVTVAPTVAPSITDFVVTPHSLPVGGGQVHMAFSAVNDTSLMINAGVGDVTGRTSLDLYVATSTSFTLTAENSAGSDFSTVPVLVAVPTAAPSISSFSASPSTLGADAGLTTLSWAETDAEQLTIDKGVGSVIGKTSIPVQVSATTEFTLTATNLHGNAQRTALVTVLPPPAPVITSFTATPQTLPPGGGSVTLSWSGDYATTFSMDQGVGDVTFDFGTTDVYVTTNTTFTLRATNVSGFDTRQVTITVQ